MRPRTPQSCISDRRAYRPAPRRQKAQQRRLVRVRREEVLHAEAFDVLPDERERRVGDVAAARRSPPGRPRATSPAAPRPAGRRRSRCRRVSVRGWEPTGVGAVFRIQLKRARDDPRVAEVVAHQPLDALLRKRARVPEDLGGLFLQRVAELVRVPLRLEVENRADAQQEILGLVQPREVLGPAPEQRSDRSAPRSSGSPSGRAACRARP